MWIIDKDHTNEEFNTSHSPGTNENATGLIGGVSRRMGKVDKENKAKTLCIFPFRMYDDDGELYYEGRSSRISVFDPLDDFGMPNAGCTRIDYLYGEEWRTL